MLRTCKICKKSKPLGQFATYRRDGETRYLYICKECHRIQERERQRKYIAAHRDAHNKRNRENKRFRYHTDPEFRDRLRAASKEYYETNKERVLEERKRRYHEGGHPFPELPARETLMSDEEEFETALAGASGRSKDSHGVL